MKRLKRLKEFKRLKADRILKAGEELFSKFGLRKTTVDKIAKKAGIAKGTVYLYYKSKEEVFAEIFNREMERIRCQVNEAVNAADGPEKKLRAYVLTRIRSLIKLATFYEPFTEECSGKYMFVEKIRKDFKVYEIELIKNILKLGMDSGKFVIDNIDFAARGVFMALKGAEHYWTRQTDEYEAEIHVNAMMNIMLNGLKER